MFPSSTPAIGAPARKASLSRVRPFGGSSIRSILKENGNPCLNPDRNRFKVEPNEHVRNMDSKLGTLGVNLNGGDWRQRRWPFVCYTALLVALSTVCVYGHLLPILSKNKNARMYVYSTRV